MWVERKFGGKFVGVERKWVVDMWVEHKFVGGKIVEGRLVVEGIVVVGGNQCFVGNLVEDIHHLG